MSRIEFHALYTTSFMKDIACNMEEVTLRQVTLWQVQLHNSIFQTVTILIHEPISLGKRASHLYIWDINHVTYILTY